MTRLRAVSLVLFVLALAISVIAGSPRYVFVCAALAVFGFVAVGFLVLPKLDCDLPFSAPAGANGEKIEIGGMEVSGSDFGDQFICTFQLAGWNRLGRWLLISAATFYVLLARIPAVETFFQENPIFSTEMGMLVGMAALVVAVSWYEEQLFLTRAAVTWGRVVDGSRYSFVRPETGYHGGSSRRLTSNPVFVLFDPSNPDRNSSVQSLQFRSLSISRALRRIQDLAAN